MNALLADPTRKPEPEDAITDWYLPSEDPISGFLYPGPAAIRDHPRLYDLAASLLKLSMEKTQAGFEEFVVRTHNRSYRGHRIDTVGGFFYALRRLPETIATLEQLGVEPGLAQLLLHPNLSKGGLILICGEPGQGKSTTCAAVVKERMERMGSFCLTVEDPPEQPLHGPHGAGRCLQTGVKAGQWATAMKGAMRCYPTKAGSMLYVGETRDEESAVEVLRIATNGHLVLTTVHSEGLETAIARYVGMASAVISPTEVRNVMASCFRLGVHQRLEEHSSANGQLSRRLKASFLFSPNERSPVAQKLRAGSESLNNEIRTQEMLLKSKGVAGVLEMWGEKRG